MSHGRAARRLDELATKLRDAEWLANISSDDFCGKHKIRCEYPMTTEYLDHQSSGQYPPFLFKPLLEKDITAHPLDPEIAEQLDDYPPGSPLEAWDISRRSYWVMDHVEFYAFNYRPTIPEDVHDFGDIQKLEKISMPDPFLLKCPCIYDYRNKNSEHGMIFEREEEAGMPRYPHIILSSYHDENGDDNSMLFGELGVLIGVMRSRAKQPKVPPGEEEALFDDHERVSSLPREFPREARFPTLMLSFLGPQHGRIFYACMDADELVIRRTKLYSFEKREDAPIDLFARVLLSKPLLEETALA